MINEDINSSCFSISKIDRNSPFLCIQFSRCLCLFYILVEIIPVFFDKKDVLHLRRGLLKVIYASNLLRCGTRVSFILLRKNNKHTCACSQSQFFLSTGQGGGMIIMYLLCICSSPSFSALSTFFFGNFVQIYHLSVMQFCFLPRNYGKFLNTSWSKYFFLFHVNINHTMLKSKKEKI